MIDLVPGTARGPDGVTAGRSGREGPDPLAPGGVEPAPARPDAVNWAPYRPAVLSGPFEDPDFEPRTRQFQELFKTP